MRTRLEGRLCLEPVRRGGSDGSGTTVPAILRWRSLVAFFRRRNGKRTRRPAKDAKRGNAAGGRAEINKGQAFRTLFYLEDGPFPGEIVSSWKEGIASAALRVRQVPPRPFDSGIAAAPHRPRPVSLCAPSAQARKGPLDSGAARGGRFLPLPWPMAGFRMGPPKKGGDSAVHRRKRRPSGGTRPESPLTRCSERSPNLRPRRRPPFRGAPSGWVRGASLFLSGQVIMPMSTIKI